MPPTSPPSPPHIRVAAGLQDPSRDQQYGYTGTVPVIILCIRPYRYLPVRDYYLHDCIRNEFVPVWICTVQFQYGTRTGNSSCNPIPPYSRPGSRR